jgi:hypothetical protein
MLIKAIIINRNLLTTLKNTIEFLRKEKRVNEIHVLDQQSTYGPLLDYYKSIPETVHYSSTNNGPHYAWDPKHKDLRMGDYFIVTDPDCIYDAVPDNWLDKMLKAKVDKIGFSLEINDLPDSNIGKEAYAHESQFWNKKHSHGWESHIDTTFALYRRNISFRYEAVRLDRPYTIKHKPWYLTKENIDHEWKYYLDHASSVSTWGSRLLKDGI